jgi:hypothetical protein
MKRVRIPILLQTLWVAAVGCSVAAASEPSRVLVDIDTTVITPDPGNRALELLAGRRAELDACLDGMAPLLERGARAVVEFDIGALGRLTKFPSGDQGVAGYGQRLDCMRRVLAALQFEKTKIPRLALMYFRLDQPFSAIKDPGRESVTFSKTEDGLRVVLTATRRPLPNGRVDIEYAATVTNIGTAPRGIRKYSLYANSETMIKPGNRDNSGILHPDESSALTCLSAGQSFSATPGDHSHDLAILPTGRRHDAVFVVVGDCAKPKTRLWVAGVRLDWTQGGDQPVLSVVPYWIHQLEPFDPRPIYR